MDRIPTLPDDVLELGQRLIPEPVFLVGCARSGTSILGEAVAAHPDVSYLFEASSIWNNAVTEGEDHRLTAEAATPEVARALYPALHEAWQAQAGSLWLEKNPKHVLRVPFLRALFPKARFLHIIRDGRDVVASLLFRNRGTEWGHLKIPGWKKLLQTYPVDNHIRCAHQWRVAVHTARCDAAELPEDRYLEVRFEQLVKQPATVLETVLRHLGLEPHNDVAEFCRKIQDETHGSYHARGQVRHYVEDHSTRVGRYIENLDGRQIRQIEEACSGLMHELRYL